MSSGESRTWFKQTEGTIEIFASQAGSVIGFSERSPDKQSDNEDAAALFSIADHCVVLAVADGMGGANCGDRAAQILIESIHERIESVENPDALREVILDAIEVANQQIIDLGTGAGATLAVAVVSNGHVRAFHVGDAVVLLCSNRGRVKYSTVAHAPLAMAVEIGVMKESEAIRHEDRNLVTNFVGSREMRIEIGPNLKMALHDTLIVGSDGLFDNLLTTEIVSFIRSGNFVKQIEKLLTVAKSRMAAPIGTLPNKPDDMTILCFRQAKKAMNLDLAVSRST